MRRTGHRTPEPREKRAGFDRKQTMKVVTEANDGHVPTTDNPVVPHGLPLKCSNCGNKFEAGDGEDWVPIGHKKYTRFTCPSCEERVARKIGTNRSINEHYLDMSVTEAFEKRQTEDDEVPTDAVLVPAGEVDPDDVGDTVVAVWEYYPDNGITNYLTVDGDDVVTQEDDPDRHAFKSDDINASVNYYSKTTKPIGYGDAFGEPRTRDDIRYGEPVLRFVKVE